MTLDETKKYTNWLITQLCIYFVLGSVILAILTALPVYRDETDGDWPHRSNLQLRIDAETGCDYLESSSGHLIPRYDKAGNQVGCK